MIKLINKIYILILILFLFPAHIIRAQTENLPRFHAGWDFSLVLPGGELEKNVPRAIPGWGLTFNYLVKNGYFMPGASFVYLKYGEQDVELTTEDGVFKLQTENILLQWHLQLRYRFSRGPIQPYMEALLGLHYIYTTTTLRDLDRNTIIGGKVNHQSQAFSYGAGFGLMIRLYNKTGENENSFLNGIQVYLDARVRFVSGDEATYYDQGAQIGEVPIDVKFYRSSTDLNTGHIGLVIAF